MNVERWVRSKKALWEKLEQLLSYIERHGIKSLKRGQLQELGRLYKSASADLSRARALSIGGDVPIYLNNLVVKAHNQVYQRRRNRWADFFHFFWITFPRMVREKFIYVAVSFLLFVVPSVISYAFVMHDKNFANLELMDGQPIVSDRMWNDLENKHLWTDSAAGFSPAISGMISANNIRVSILAFALGITCGIGTVFVIVANGIMIGTVFGACRHHGMAYELLSFVAGHGALELSAIFISGAAGLVLAKALLFPGDYRRSDALRAAAKPALMMFVGCIPILLVAGTIEGFISPRLDITSSTKFAVSIGTFILLLLYLFVPRNRKVQESL